MAQHPYGPNQDRRNLGRDERDQTFEGPDWRRTGDEERSFDRGQGSPGGDRARPESRGSYGPDASYRHQQPRAHGRTAEPYWPYGDRDDAYGASGGYWPYGEPEDRRAQARFRPGPQTPAGQGFWNRAIDQVGSWMSGDRVGPGQYRGMGPRGYSRSDERIREDVSDALAEDEWLDASDVEVKVEAGEVTLNGTVRQRQDKRRAELFAEHCPGVTHVQNNLRLKPATGAQADTRDPR